MRRLDSTDRRLVLEAALFTAVVRLALSALSLRTSRGLLARLSPRAHPRPTEGLENIARAVTRARAIVPGATCLVQALVLQALLRRRGHGAQLRLGFVRRAEGVLGGHAWVESEGRVFDETGEASCYAPARDFAGQGS